MSEQFDKLNPLSPTADAALREGAAIVVQVADMEEHNLAIFKGKWRKGAKAWSGDFIERLRKEGIAKLREAIASNAAPQVPGTAVNLPELRDRLDSSGPSVAEERAETPKIGLIADQADVSRPAGAASFGDSDAKTPALNLEEMRAPFTPKDLHEALSLAQRWRGIYSDESYGPQGKCLGTLARAVIALYGENMMLGAPPSASRAFVITPETLADAKGPAAIEIPERAELIRLLHQRYQDLGDTLARKAAWALEDTQPEAKANYGDYLDAALMAATGSILSPYAAEKIRGYAREMLAKATQSPQRCKKEQP